MLIKNTNLRRIVSLLFVLCLLFCLVPTAAFAVVILDNESGKTIASVNAGDTMETNYGIITTNYGTITTNNGIIKTNKGIVTENFGKVTNDHNFGRVTYNFDTVYYGTVMYNCGGHVIESVTDIYFVIKFDCFYVKIDSNVLAGDIPIGPLADPNKTYDIPENGVVYRQNLEGTYCKLWGVKDIIDNANDNIGSTIPPKSITLTLKPGYEPYIKLGDGEIESLGNNAYKITTNGDDIELDVKYTGTSSVPATADMSNVPLWSAMLLVFAATAILTRKKKNG